MNEHSLECKRDGRKEQRIWEGAIVINSLTKETSTLVKE